MTAVTKRQQPPGPALDNVDPREDAYYRQLASRWWDTSGPFWPLHRLNALRSGEDSSSSRNASWAAFTWGPSGC